MNPPSISPPEVAILFRDLPGLERNAEAMERAAVDILAGKDPEIPEPHKQRLVAAELRRRAKLLRG